MHIAAALQKPTLCFFGASNIDEWHPWHVPYHILKTTSQRVADIQVEEVIKQVDLLTR
jgi:hypothetical protein